MVLPVLVVVSQGRGRSVNNPTTLHRLAWVWLLLAVGFAGVTVRDIYRTFYQEVFGELLLDKILGLADGIPPLAVLCLSIFFLQRRTRLRGLVVQILVSMTIGLGLCFLGVSLFELFDSWPEPEKSFQPGSLILIILGFVGYPLGVVLVGYRYWNRRATMAGLMATSWPFLVCLGLYILAFPLSWVWPFGSASLYAAASLALFFAATNFSLLTNSTDL
jgi:hypothetical protein